MASLRVGQKYDGETYPYLSPRLVALTVTDATGTRPYRGNEGDRPAIGTVAGAPGMTVLTYVSRPSRLIYKDWETFLKYTTNEGLTDAVERHLADGLPRTGFREDYQRHAKALVQVGPVDPAERESARGLDLEIVSLGNPFDPATEMLKVRLMRFGAPAPDVQIAIFRKGGGSGEATVEKLRTDGDGYAKIALQDGMDHLLNAVVMDRSSIDGIDWESDWASLTFSRPASAE